MKNSTEWGGQSRLPSVHGLRLGSAPDVHSDNPDGIVKLTPVGDNRPMGSLYRRYRFPPEIISHAVWRYHRFTLSFRDVEESVFALLNRRLVSVNQRAQI